MRHRLIGVVFILTATLGADAVPGSGATTDPALAVLAATQAAVKAGLIGEIQLDDDTNVGFRNLAPGRYRVQHIKTEKGHSVRFSPVGGHELLHRPVIVECMVEPLKEPAPSTLLRLRLGTYHMEVVKLYIEGESVAHVF